MHSDNSSENYHFSFTCPKCTYRGNRTHDSNYVSVKLVDGLGGSYRRWSESDKYPERCRECNRKAKRHTRMVNRFCGGAQSAETKMHETLIPTVLGTSNFFLECRIVLAERRIMLPKRRTRRNGDP